ncbi:hypothetical protein G5714_000327 [Onychostoma macrolepis]|uniref:Uncharacterized protein n=1 Tax=Onychostoma macrolepis TaxID=369639 RepID=A0A7J6DG12_9TELE|nr:hypothetical protein G5714_000327 [Onychostoma macrolepis]
MPSPVARLHWCKSAQARGCPEANSTDTAADRFNLHYVFRCFLHLSTLLISFEGCFTPSCVSLIHTQIQNGVIKPIRVGGANPRGL